MYNMYNIGSIMLGLFAWGFGFSAMKRKNNNAVNNLSAISFSMCILSLLFQFFEIKSRADIKDFAAIDDTIGGIVFAAVTLTVITILLNTAALVKNKTLRGQ